MVGLKTCKIKSESKTKSVESALSIDQRRVHMSAESSSQNVFALDIIVCEYFKLLLIWVVID